MRARLSVLLCVVLVAITGCGSLPGLYDMSLPGGADVGDDPYRVTAHFTDVLDLVPHSGVKVADVDIGRVQQVRLSDDGTTAEVTLVVRADVELPANAVARLRQSSVLGEKFVELAAPPGEPATGALADGAVIGVERTNRNTEVEEVLGALSLLLNGGGVGQLNDITRELNAAFAGNAPELKALLGNLDEFLGSLDEHRDDIVRALEGSAELSESLRERKDKIVDVLDGMEPGMRVLADQRAELVELLTALGELSEVAVDTVEQSRDDIVAQLQALEPTLRKLTEAGEDLPRGMEMLLTFPFPDAVLDAVRGDYLNSYLTLDANTEGGG